MVDGSDALAQTSWNYLNDASRLDLCLRFDTRVIACAAMHLAALALQFPLPGRSEIEIQDENGHIFSIFLYPLVLSGGKKLGVEDAEKGEETQALDCEWWRLFGVDLTLVVEVGSMITHLYEMPQVG